MCTVINSKQNIQIQDKSFQLLLTPETISARVTQLGNDITADYAEKNPLIIGILKGSLIFLADLLRCIDVHCQVDFLHITRYRGSDTPHENVFDHRDLTETIADRHVLIIEDIIDKGRTLSTVLSKCHKRKPASIQVAALLRKESAPKIFNADYLGFTIPDKFIVGYGLDYCEYGRNIPGIFIEHTEVI